MTAANHWTLVAHRGSLVLAFVLIALLSPEKSLAWFAPLMLFYAMSDGVLTIAAAARAVLRRERYGWLVVEGLAGLSGIVVIAVWPDARIPVLAWTLSAWAVVTAAGAVLMAVNLEKRRNRPWLLATGAVVFLRFAILAIGATRAGEFELAFWSWTGSLLFTVVLLALLLRASLPHRGTAALREGFAR
jgi:uncharacterized membrane protein HdeD (DUF308 family)